jgi:predicted nuclease with RNAse H fold
VGRCFEFAASSSSSPPALEALRSMLALGVDVSVSRGLDLVLLDEHRQFVGRPLRAQTADDLAHILSTHRPEIVAIDSPPSFGISGASRVAERELLKLGIHSYFTPSGPEKARKKFYDWMRVGFRVFEAADHAAYSLFAGKGSLRRHALEVFPHASAVALKGSLPPSGTCQSDGRKRRWRAAVLDARGVDARQLRSTDEVDAALAALTGLFALKGRFWTVGDPGEGMIVLPGRRPEEPFRRELANGNPIPAA